MKSALLLLNQVHLPNVQQAKHWDTEVAAEKVFVPEAGERRDRRTSLPPLRQGGWDRYRTNMGEGWGNQCSVLLHLRYMLLHIQKWRPLTWSEGEGSWPSDFKRPLFRHLCRSSFGVDSPSQSYLACTGQELTPSSYKIAGLLWNWEGIQLKRGKKRK